MKASEMIKDLRELKKKYGDKKIHFNKPYDSEALLVMAYDEDGRGEKDDGFKGVSQFYIH